MDPIAFGLAFMKESWNISIVVSKYILLFVTLYGFWIHREIREKTSEFFKKLLNYSFGRLLVEIGICFIFGIMGAGLIAMFYENSIIIYSVFLIISLPLLAFKEIDRDHKEISKETETGLIRTSLSLFFVSMLLISLILQNSLLNRGMALIFYGIIFWLV